MGIHCIDLKDWSRAIKALHLSAEAHSVLFGKNDPRFLGVTKLYAKAKAAKQLSVNGTAEHVEADVPESPVEQIGGMRINTPTSPRSPRSKAKETPQSQTEDILLSAQDEVLKHVKDSHILPSPRISHSKSSPIHQPEIMHKAIPKSAVEDEDPYASEDDFYPASPER